MSIEIGALFGANDWGGVFAYLASPTNWWLNPSKGDDFSRYFVIGMVQPSTTGNNHLTKGALEKSSAPLPSFIPSSIS